MGLAGFISKIVEGITKTTFRFNKTLDTLIEKFKESCPSTQELRNLIQQKNEINGALVEIEQKIATLNKVAAGAEVAVDALKVGVTIIKQLPVPTAFPPGIGIPVSIINNFSDALDNLGTLIDKEDASIEAIPEALELISKDVGEVISKLNDLDVALNDCLEKDPNITQADLDAIVATTGNFVDVLSDAELDALLSNPPGLLYGDYYLRKQIVPTIEDFSFDKKQITAQNKESVPPPGEYYNPNIKVEMLYGDESFSSSNVVLVEEMKWLIDTKDLIFPPPEPEVDPLKAIQKASQVAILQAIYGANAEEADELYEMAWELSQNEGPNKGYYDTLVVDAFDNSRTVLEQAVANEGYEFQQGDRILNSTIKTLFLADYASTVNEIQLKAAISQIKNQARALLKDANEIGGSYNKDSKRWNKDGDFTNNPNNKLYPYSERLAATAENLFSDNTIGNAFLGLRPEMAKRKPLMQAIFEVANILFLSGKPYNFKDPLKDYFQSKAIGYNQPIINSTPISGDNDSLITSEEIDLIYDLELDNTYQYYYDNLLPPNYDSTLNGLTEKQIKAYAKTQIFLKLKDTLGIIWYNKNAQFASELPFWAPSGGNPTDSTYYQGKDANYGLLPSDPWYFEFGRNGLPIPTDS
tara:strand:+ start:3156 stop:5075 length:1920 start_codon:yes stop_codon:yes gene_type:complete